jgi:hypothetical protein
MKDSFDLNPRPIFATDLHKTLLRQKKFLPGFVRERPRLNKPWFEHFDNGSRLTQTQHYGILKGNFNY